MTEDGVLALLAALSLEDGMSLPKLAKKLALSQSALLRTLTALGRPEFVEGLGFVEVRGENPARLHMTEAGRAWLEQRREA